MRGASGLCGAIYEDSAGNRRKGFPRGSGAVRMMRGASGLCGAIYEASAGNRRKAFPGGSGAVSVMRGASGLCGAVDEASAGNRRKGFPCGSGAVRMMRGASGLCGAIYEALLHIARNGCRLRLSPFRQCVRPRINCACFPADWALSPFRQCVRPRINCACFWEVLGSVSVMRGASGLWGAVHEALLQIAGNGCRLRLSPFPQFVRPRMNCTCFWEYQQR